MSLCSAEKTTNTITTTTTTTIRITTTSTATTTTTTKMKSKTKEKSKKETSDSSTLKLTTYAPVTTKSSLLNSSPYENQSCDRKCPKKLIDEIFQEAVQSLTDSIGIAL